MTVEKGAGQAPHPFFCVRHDRLDSTNDEAQRLIASGQPDDLTVIQARRQSSGRGRRGREWLSPPDNLYFSIIIDTRDRPFGGAPLGLVAAIALVDAMASLNLGASFACKWPNDLMADQRKLAGMLLETAANGQWLILGIGVNVAHCPADDQVETPAVCLAQLGYRGTSETVLETFCHCFGPKIALWRTHGFASFQSQWVERAYGLNQTIRVRLPDQTIFGRFVGLDPDGALLLAEAATGEVKRILAGDVFIGEGGRHASSH